MKQVRLSGSDKVVLISDQDFKRANQYKWWVATTGYAVRVVYEGRNKPRKTIYMHRFITGCSKGLVVDHINHNRLDNRRSNLRICKHAENLRWSSFRSTNTSGYIGVSKHGATNKWRAYIRNKHLGTFDTALEAAKVRDKHATKMFGPFANLNITE